MMFWVIGYIALVSYAAGLFTWSVAHGREGAALGILMSISGLQLTIMETVHPTIGVALASAGLVVVGRDVVLAFRRSDRFALAFAQLRGHHDETV